MLRVIAAVLLAMTGATTGVAAEAGSKVDVTWLPGVSVTVNASGESGTGGATCAVAQRKQSS